MNTKQENYFGNYKLLFGTPGWKQFQEDIEVSMEDVMRAMINEEDYGKIMKLKGQYKQLQFFAAFEMHMKNFEEQTDEDLEEFDDDL